MSIGVYPPLLCSHLLPTEQTPVFVVYWWRLFSCCLLSVNTTVVFSAASHLRYSGLWPLDKCCTLFFLPHLLCTLRLSPCLSCYHCYSWCWHLSNCRNSWGGERGHASDHPLAYCTSETPSGCLQLSSNMLCCNSSCMRGRPLHAAWWVLHNSLSLNLKTMRWAFATYIDTISSATFAALTYWPFDYKASDGIGWKCFSVSLPLHQFIFFRSHKLDCFVALMWF